MPDTSAFIVPEARGLTGMQATLRVTVALQCWGTAAARLLDAGSSPFVYMRSIGLDQPVAELAWMDQAAGGFLLAAGLLSLTRPAWPVLILVTVIFAADAFAPVGFDPGWLSWLSVGVGAASIIAPVALLLIDWWPPKARFSLARFLIAILFVRYAVGGTFLALGLKAIHQSRHAGDLTTQLQAVADRTAGRALTEDAAGWALALIGAISLAFALNVLASRSRGMMCALAVWGLLLVSLPLLSEGAFGVCLVFGRLAWVGLPIVLLLYWSRSIEEGAEVLRPK